MPVEEYRPKRRYDRSAPIRTRTPPWRLSDRALRRAFAEQSGARTVRSVLVRLAEEIRMGREAPIDGNLRTLGYRYVLPVWVRLPALRTGPWYRPLVREARRLCTERGGLSYVDLGITDTNWESRRIGTRRPEVVAFAEDLDFVRLFRRATAAHGITTVAFGGSLSTITVEYTARHIREAMEATHRTGRPLQLLALTDYDPHGWDNAHALQRRFADFGHPDSKLRFAVHPGLLDRRTLDRVKVPLSRRGAMARVLSRWLEATNGIDGDPAKVEATSIPPRVLLAELGRLVREVAPD